MRIFCKGFNLYNQLNVTSKCVTDFECSIEDVNLSFFEMKHTFSIMASNNTIKLFCNFIERNTLNFKDVKDIKYISCNDNAVIIVNNSGNIYKFLIENPDNLILVPKFKDDSNTIKILNCGSKLNFVYTDDGDLYSIPEKLNFQNKNIVHIQTGREHCLLLDSLGNVYAFGRGSRGQLGLGHLNDEFSPKLIEALAGIKISSIAAGGWHSAAVSIEGDLYIWGWNGNGQLGLLDKSQSEVPISVMATPQVVDLENYSENRIIQVACGNRHTIVLLDNNYICGTGWNKYKQLKNEDQENYYKFIYIADFSKEHIHNIVCGPWNTAVICQ